MKNLLSTYTANEGMVNFEETKKLINDVDIVAEKLKNANCCQISTSFRDQCAHWSWESVFLWGLTDCHVATLLAMTW